MLAYCSAHGHSVLVWNYFDMTLTRSHVSFGLASTRDFNNSATISGAAVLPVSSCL